MRQIKNIVLGIAILFIIALTGNAQNSQKPSKDEVAIRANVEQMAKGWNTKSAVEFAKPFAENADYVEAATQNQVAAKQTWCEKSG